MLILAPLGTFMQTYAACKTAEDGGPATSDDGGTCPPDEQNGPCPPGCDADSSASTTSSASGVTILGTKHATVHATQPGYMAGVHALSGLFATNGHRASEATRYEGVDVATYTHLDGQGGGRAPLVDSNHKAAPTLRPATDPPPGGTRAQAHRLMPTGQPRLQSRPCPLEPPGGTPVTHGRPRVLLYTIRRRALLGAWSDPFNVTTNTLCTRAADAPDEHRCPDTCSASSASASGGGRVSPENQRVRKAIGAMRDVHRQPSPPPPLRLLAETRAPKPARGCPGPVSSCTHAARVAAWLMPVRRGLAPTDGKPLDDSTPTHKHAI